MGIYKIEFVGGRTYYYCSEKCVGVEKPEYQTLAVPILLRDIPAGKHCFGCGCDLKGQGTPISMPLHQSESSARLRSVSPTPDEPDDGPVLGYSDMYRYMYRRGRARAPVEQPAKSHLTELTKQNEGHAFQILGAPKKPLTAKFYIRMCEDGDFIGKIEVAGLIRTPEAVGDILHYVAPGESYWGRTFAQWKALIDKAPVEMEVAPLATEVEPTKSHLTKQSEGRAFQIIGAPNEKPRDVIE